MNEMCDMSAFKISPSKPLFYGSTESFINSMLPTEWKNWDSIRHIRERLDSETVEKYRAFYWDSEAGGEPRVFTFCKSKRERDVALAIFTVRNHRHLRKTNRSRQSIMHVAAEHASAELVRLILTSGGESAQEDAYGDSPLHIATRLGRIDVVKALTTRIDHEIESYHPYYRIPFMFIPCQNIKALNHDGRDPLHIASEMTNSSSHRTIISILCATKCADIDSRRLGDGYSPAHIAIANHDMECLKVCLECGADSEVRNFKSETHQQLAYSLGRQDMVDLCRAKGSSKFQLMFMRKYEENPLNNNQSILLSSNRRKRKAIIERRISDHKRVRFTKVI